MYAYDENAKDGLTPYRKIRGIHSNIALPPFGECVAYRVRTNRKLEVRWGTGIFLGIRLHFTHYREGARKGVVVVQSIRRKPEDQQWNVELLQSIQGTPWAPNPSTVRGSREALELPEPLAISVEQPEAAKQRQHLTRHISNVYLFDKMTLISLDIQQDAKLAHSFVKVLINKEFLTMKIAVQELFRGCRKQSMVGEELRLQGRRRKVLRVNQKRSKRLKSRRFDLQSVLLVDLE